MNGDRLMSSNYYMINKQVYRRSKKQGSPKASEIDKAVCVSLAPSALKVIDENASKANMSRSAWLELAGVLFTI